MHYKIIGYQAKTTVETEQNEQTQVVPGDIAGESVCSLGPAARKEKDPFSSLTVVFIGTGTAGLGEFLGGVLSPPSSSSSIGGQ